MNNNENESTKKCEMKKPQENTKPSHKKVPLSLTAVLCPILFLLVLTNFTFDIRYFTASHK